MRNMMKSILLVLAMLVVISVTVAVVRSGKQEVGTRIVVETQVKTAKAEVTTGSAPKELAELPQPAPQAPNPGARPRESAGESEAGPSAQAPPQGTAISQCEEQISALLAQLSPLLEQLREMQMMLPGSQSAEGTPPIPSEGRSPLDIISESLPRISEIIQQVRELPESFPRRSREPSVFGSEVQPSLPEPVAQPSASGSEGQPSLPEPVAQPSAPGSEGQPSLPEPVAQPSAPGSEVQPSLPGSEVQPPAPSAGGGPLAAAEQGYESVFMDVTLVNRNRLQVRINGLLAGKYDGNSRGEINSLLRTGTVNTLTFTFARGDRKSSVQLAVKAPGRSYVEVFKFVPSEDTLEDSFEVSFAGAR